VRNDRAESKFERVCLKKQSQFAKGKNDVKSLLTMIYGDFGVLRRRKNKPNSKPNKANLPTFGWKTEASRKEEFIAGLLDGNQV